VLKPVPVGILFKSAHTRGGFADNIRIHDLTMTDVPVVFRVTMNWNPSYSYATIPSGRRIIPTTGVCCPHLSPRTRAARNFHDVHIWNIKQQERRPPLKSIAFPQVPLERFTLDHLDIQAHTAGHIADTRDWKFSDIVLKTEDGSKVAVSNSVNIVGLPKAE